ncbi:MAG: hypothetical protein ACXAEU_04465 [Candidatus Hodarchaeales archaeon]
MITVLPSESPVIVIYVVVLIIAVLGTYIPVRSIRKREPADILRAL